MSEFDQDRDYQALHKKYQSGADELPPIQLDQNILEAAHRSVKLADQPGVDTVPVKRAWYVPVSYVAILVISLSVMMKLAFEPNLPDQIEFNSIKPDSIGAGMPEETEIHKSTMNNDSGDLSKSKQQVQAISEKRPQSAKSPERKLHETMAVDSLLMQKKEKKSTIQIQQHAMPAASSVAEPEINSRALPQASNLEAEEVSSGSASQLTSDVMVEAPDSEQAYIDQMMHLLESEQFERLEVMLKNYHKIYAHQDQELPQALRDWQAKKTSEPLQND